jgi:hypothetical protein
MRPARRLTPAALALVALLVLCGVAGGCGRERALSSDERMLAVWFIEDVAHGHPRRPAELALTAPSVAMHRLADWLSGGTNGRYQQGGERAPEDYHPPLALAARAERWVSLRALFAAHQVVALGGGLVAARPDLKAEDAVVALPVVDHENLDRRALDALVVGMGGDGSGAGDRQAWLELSAATRRELDLQAGAEPWPPPAKPKPAQATAVDAKPVDAKPAQTRAATGAP